MTRLSLLSFFLRFILLPVVLLPAVLLVPGCADRSPIQPEGPGSGFTELATGEVGPAGGQVAGGSLTVTVPSGSFAANVTITLSSSSEDRPFGAGQVTDTYRISGLPEDYRQPITVSLSHTTKSDDEELLVALGEEGFCRTQNNVRVRYRILPGADAGGVITAEIPAPSEKRGRSSGRRASGGFGFDCTIIAGYTHYTTPEGHFRISLPLGYLRNHQQMGQFLEEAFRRFQELGFSYAARTNWPVSVTVKELTDDGGAMSSRLGDDHGYMELAVGILDDLSNLRVTCAHEFFHIVQGLYDPRTPRDQARSPSPHYWADEAAAVWSEELFTATQPYASAARNGYQMAPFHGMQKGAEEDAQHHGYGMSAVIKYLADAHGTDYVPAIYQRIRGGSDPVAAVCRDDPAGWWEDFLSDYMLGSVYSDVSRATWFTNAEERWTIAGPADTIRAWTRSYADLSGAIYEIRLANRNLKPSDRLVFTLAGAPKGHLTLFRYNTTTTERLEASPSSVTIADLPGAMSQGWNYFALVTSGLYGTPYTTVRSLTLQARIPKTPGFLSAPNCRIELNDFYVTYLYSDGRTHVGTLNKTFEVEGGTWTGNTFAGTTSGAPREQISVTVDPGSLRITAFSARETGSSNDDLLIEGAIPLAPNTSEYPWLAVYTLQGSNLCANIRKVDFSNYWGTRITGYTCGASSSLELVFW